MTKLRLMVLEGAITRVTGGNVGDVMVPPGGFLDFEITRHSGVSVVEKYKRGEDAADSEVSRHPERRSYGTVSERVEQGSRLGLNTVSAPTPMNPDDDDMQQFGTRGENHNADSFVEAVGVHESPAPVSDGYSAADSCGGSAD